MNKNHAKFVCFFLQQYQQEKSELDAALKQKTKENKRMKASFDSIKELNDAMKKQVRNLTSCYVFLYIYIYTHYIAKSIGTPSNERFDYFSNFHKYKS